MDEVAKGIHQTQENAQTLSSKFDYFRNNIHDPETRAALINALSSEDDSDENGSSDEKPSAFAKGGGKANLMQTLGQKFAHVQQLDAK